MEGSKISGLLTIFAALIESPSELFYIESLKSGQVSARLIAEGVALLFKSVSTYLLLR